MRFWMLAIAAFASVASAQSGSPSAVITGTVLDSLHNEPLSGASVSVAGQNRTVTTDSTGRFSIDQLPAGRYDVIVGHPFADSLGILLRLTGIDVLDGGRARVLVALPGLATIRSAICPQPSASVEKGVIRGRVTQAGTHAASAGAQVNLSWVELDSARGKDRGGFRPGGAGTVTDDQGYYSFCGLPEDFEGSIQARSGDDSTSLVTVSLSWSQFGLGFRPLLLPASSGTRTSSVSGTVTDSSGKAVAAASVDLLGTSISATSRRDGTFTLANVPTGTLMVRVRKVGYSARTSSVDVDSPTSRQLDLLLDNPIPRLVPTIVRAMRSEVAARTGFDKRALVGPGRYVTPDQLAKHTSKCLLDGLPFAVPRGDNCSVGSGFTPMTHFRGVSTLLGLEPTPAGSDALRMPAASSSTTACIRVIIDDIPEPGGSSLYWLDRSEVVGIEYYSGSSSPVRLGTGQCYALMIWTIWYRGSHH